jgi:hypothetical protein
VHQAADLVGRQIALRVILTRTPVLKQRVTEHSKAQFEKAGLLVLPVELVHRNAFQSMTYTGHEPYLVIRRAGLRRTWKSSPTLWRGSLACQCERRSRHESKGPSPSRPRRR